ncbi:MAG: glycine betaine ABC transporter substrate-binding protein [Acidaminobacteraceae bacterium]
MNKKYLILSLILTLSLSLVACSSKSTTEPEVDKEVEAEQTVEKKLIFADGSWDSIRLHNVIAGYILENAYGYEIEMMPGSSPNLIAGQAAGDVNVFMENWPDNFQGYQPAIDEGSIVEVGLNFDDNAQGFYVPRYLIEGDEARGIKALAPDLKTVEDLKKYAALFPDEEDPGRSAIINAPPTWGISEVMEKKFENYNFGEQFNLISSGSDSGLSASLSSAYEKGDPWVGYYWEPTWISGKYDIVLLEETPYTDELWADGYNSAIKAVRCTITVDKATKENHPEVVEFLSKYKTSSALVSEMLAYMMNNDVDIDQTAEWFLKEKQDVWKDWLPADKFEQILTSLEK